METNNKEIQEYIQHKVAEIMTDVEYIKEGIKDAEHGSVIILDQMTLFVNLLKDIRQKQVELDKNLELLNRALKKLNPPSYKEAVGGPSLHKEGSIVKEIGSSKDKDEIMRDTDEAPPHTPNKKDTWEKAKNNKGKGKIVITTDEEYVPLNHLEQKYSQISDLGYTIWDNKPYYRAPGKNIYPRIICIQGADPLRVKEFFDYGFLHMIYPSKDLKEISEMGIIFCSEVSKFAKGRNIYLKFYSISPEIDKNIFYEASHIISIGYQTADISMDLGEEIGKIPRITPRWIKTRRALGMKAIRAISKNFYERNYKVLAKHSTWMLITPGVSKSKILYEYWEKLTTHTFPCTEETRKEACRIDDCCKDDYSG